MSLLGLRRADHIHTADDGRGRRRVTVDGNQVDNVVYADTRKGIVRHADKPPRIHRHGKRIIERTKHGRVEIEFI